MGSFFTFYIFIFFFAALLSHQLEQLFKLERELRQEKQEVGAVRAEVQVSLLQKNIVIYFSEKY